MKVDAGDAFYARFIAILTSKPRSVSIGSALVFKKILRFAPASVFFRPLRRLRPLRLSNRSEGKRKSYFVIIGCGADEVAKAKAINDKFELLSCEVEISAAALFLESTISTSMSMAGSNYCAGVETLEVLSLEMNLANLSLESASAIDGTTNFATVYPSKSFA